MPRIFFTGRKKIARSGVSVILRAGRPPEFQATINPTSFPRGILRTAKVVLEAYHSTMLQRFDFGTVGDCRPRQAERLTSFDEWDRPRFRLLVVDTECEPGVVLAACDSINAVDADSKSSGGRSKLQLIPKPDAEMRGELWKLRDIRDGFQLWYNKDVACVASGIKGKHPESLGLILPAALREILSRTHLWEGVATEWSEWTSFAVSLSGEPFPAGDGEAPPSVADVEGWIDNVIEAFCRRRGRFIERIAAMEEVQSSTSAD